MLINVKIVKYGVFVIFYWSSESVSGLDKGKFGSAKNTCFGGFEQVSTLSKHDSSLSLHKYCNYCANGVLSFIVAFSYGSNKGKGTG